MVQRVTRVQRDIAGMNFLLDTLARREMIGERAKDRALEREKMKFGLQDLRQRGEAQRGQQELQMLSLSLQSKEQMAKLDLQAEELNLRGTESVIKMKRDSQRFSLEVAAHRREAEFAGLRVKEFATKQAMNKFEVMGKMATVWQEYGQLASKRKLENAAHEIAFGDMIKSQFGYTNADTVWVPHKHYEDLFSNLSVAYNGMDPATIMGKYLLPKFHSTFQRVKDEEMKAHNANAPIGLGVENYENLPQEIRERTVRTALGMFFGEAPNPDNPSGGILISSAFGRVGRETAFKERDKLVQEYGQAEGIKRWHAQLLGATTRDGKFTNKMTGVNVSGFASGQGAIEAMQSTVALMVDGLHMATPMHDALPGYSTARAGKEAATRAERKSFATIGSVVAQMYGQAGAIANGNPDGLTPEQFVNVGRNSQTASDAIFHENMSPEESLRNLSKMLGLEGTEALLEDAQVKFNRGYDEDIPVGIAALDPESMLPPTNPMESLQNLVSIVGGGIKRGASNVADFIGDLDIQSTRQVESRSVEYLVDKHYEPAREARKKFMSMSRVGRMKFVYPDTTKMPELPMSNLHTLIQATADTSTVTP